jgi:DNA polymerase III subunit delta
MSEIQYKDLKKHIQSAEKEGFSGLYLICGEEMLCKTALEELLKAMIPEEASREMGYEPLDGTNGNIFDAIERVNTFSFSAGRKVVALTDSGIFHSKESQESLLTKAKEASAQNDMKKAARYFTGIMSLLNLSFEDVGRQNRKESLNLDDTISDYGWMDDVIAYCVENSINLSSGEDSASFLMRSVAKGFPKGNHLIIISEHADKRLNLYKVLNKNGIIIDCQVSKGGYKEDRISQESVISERMNSILSKSGKSIDKDAYLAMYEMTGFDLRTFLNNLEKLIAYTGQRKNITAGDVEAVLERTKTDPIYDFTNALSDRNIESSLTLLDSLLSSGIHPLQALSAVINHFRKLVFQKGFAESSYGKSWNPDFSYQRFSSVTMPAIIEYEENLTNIIEGWEKFFVDEDKEEEAEKRRKKPVKKKSRTHSDLFIAKNARTPYPLYQLFKKADNFKKEELLFCYEKLSKADIELKSSGGDPKLVLVNLIFQICLKK